MYKFYVLIFIAFIPVLSSCSNVKCIPGNYDGAWETDGKEAVLAEDIQRKLVGVNVSSANNFLEGSISSNDFFEDGKNYRTWVFESHKKLVQKDCVGPDKVTYRQEVMIVKALVDQSNIKSCSIVFRGSISEHIREINEIISSEPGPLDREKIFCQ
jgi:hypothetical protein